MFISEIGYNPQDGSFTPGSGFVEIMAPLGYNQSLTLVFYATDLTNGNQRERSIRLNAANTRFTNSPNGVLPRVPLADFPEWQTFTVVRAAQVGARHYSYRSHTVL